MKKLFLFLLVFLEFSGWSQREFPQRNILLEQLYPAKNDSIFQHQKLEIGITLPNEIQQKIDYFTQGFEVDSNQKINPFLEWELKIDAIFTHLETQNEILQPAFYYEDFTAYSNPLFTPADGTCYTDAEYNRLGGWERKAIPYSFLVRFAPPKIGSWMYQIRLETPDTIIWSPATFFEVNSGKFKAPVEVASNKRFLQQGEKSILPQGMNAAWAEGNPNFDAELFEYHSFEVSGVTYYMPEYYRTVHVTPRVQDRYRKLLSRFADQGVQIFRLIMAPTGSDIEWEKLGDYSDRMNLAYELDKTLALAEERDLLILWDLAIHYTFKKNVYYISKWDWVDADGTPSYAYKKAFDLKEPIDFFKSEACKKYYKQRLRYILARWGYSNNIALFELMSEISNIGSDVDDGNSFYNQNTAVYEAWQREMGSYIKSFHNGEKHLLTASYSGEINPSDRTFFQNPDFEVISSNIYDFGQPDFNLFFPHYVSRTFLNEDPAASNRNVYTLRTNSDSSVVFDQKPLIFSESEPAQALRVLGEKTSIETNRFIWEASFSGLALCLSWSNWYDTSNYEIYGKVARFFENIPLNAENWHPGASKLVFSDSIPRWVYNELAWENMHETKNRVGLSYLRSGLKNKAIGMLSNHTFNYLSAHDSTELADELSKHLRKPRDQRLNRKIGGIRLKISDLENGNYRITYFLPHNQDEIIYESFQKGTDIRLDFPRIKATKEEYLVLFRVEKVE